MKKILVIGMLVLAAACLALGRTRGDGTSKPDNNAGAQDQSQCATLTFLTESLPNFYVGVHANYDIEAIGGTPPYRFEITSGTLPAGLTFKKNGTIKGTPTAVTDTTIFVKLTDKEGCTLTQAFAVRVDMP